MSVCKQEINGRLEDIAPVATLLMDVEVVCIGENECTSLLFEEDQR